MSDLESPFPEFPESEFQIPLKYQIFYGAIDAIQAKPYNGSLFSVSMNGVSVNYVPHLIDSVTIDPENMDACRDSIVILSTYSHRRATDGTAGMIGMIDYAPILSRTDYKQAHGAAPSSPATFASIIRDTISTQHGRVNDMSVANNVTAWAFAASQALNMIDLEILKDLEFHSN